MGEQLARLRRTLFRSDLGTLLFTHYILNPLHIAVNLVPDRHFHAPGPRFPGRRSLALVLGYQRRVYHLVPVLDPDFPVFGYQRRAGQLVPVLDSPVLDDDSE